MQQKRCFMLYHAASRIKAALILNHSHEIHLLWLWLNDLCVTTCKTHSWFSDSHWVCTFIQVAHAEFIKVAHTEHSTWRGLNIVSEEQAAAAAIIAPILKKRSQEKRHKKEKSGWDLSLKKGKTLESRISAYRTAVWRRIWW